MKAILLIYAAGRLARQASFGITLSDGFTMRHGRRIAALHFCSAPWQAPMLIVYMIR